MMFNNFSYIQFQQKSCQQSAWLELSQCIIFGLRIKMKIFSGQDQEPDSTTSHSLAQQQEYQTLEIAEYCQGLQFFTK